MIEATGEPRRSGTGTTARSHAVPPLVLGPVLRHVDETTATVWVQLDRAATVTVTCWAVDRLRRSPAQPKSGLGCTTRTFEVRGASLRARVASPVWSRTPPIPTTSTSTARWCGRRRSRRSRRARCAPAARRRRDGTGSSSARAATPRCRRTRRRRSRRSSASTRSTPSPPPTARQPREEWPDALLLLGDQVYADELTPQNRRRIAGRRDRHPEWPDDEIVGFDEYVGLYRDSWSDPEVRWLLSCVPTGMIFDDHDVRDDWNTSAVWRAEMAREAVVAGAHPVRARVVLGLPAPGQPVRRRASPPTPTTRQSSAAEGDTWPLLAAARGPGRRRDRREQGRAVQLPLGPRRHPVRHDRLTERADPGRRRAPHARRRRVRLDRGAGA